MRAHDACGWIADCAVFLLFFCFSFSVTALSSVVRLYERELHSKHLILHALDNMLHSSDADGDEQQQDAGTGASTSQLLLPLPAPGAAALAATRTPSSVHSLELYLSSWMMEPELDSETMVTVQHLWESQLPASK